MRQQRDSSGGPPSSSGANCPDAGLLVEHARGALEPAQRELVTNHLDTCDDCREVLALWTRAPARSPSPTPSAEYPPRPGDLVAGKYEVERVLGLGGMGVVLAAHHKHMAKTVALKLMLPQAMSAETTERFLREARAAAQVQGEHVARVLDVGTLDDSTPFLVMEYLEGKDLARLLRDRGSFPVSEAVGFVVEACEALAEAHALGIVHRDLKPANLFVSARADGSPIVKVLDFGISKVPAKGKEAESSLTKSETVLGTPLYMSPEQLRSTRSVGPTTDLWALGCVLYELLAGRPAFWADSPQALGALIATGPAPRIRELRSDVPIEVEDAILSCLEKDPARRVASAAELAARLGPFAPAEMMISVARAARISVGGSALPFADTLTSDPPAAMTPAGVNAPVVATAGSFVRSQSATGGERSPKDAPRRAALYLALGLAAAALIGGVSYAFGLRGSAVDAVRTTNPPALAAATLPATASSPPAPSPASSRASEPMAEPAASVDPGALSASPKPAVAKELASESVTPAKPAGTGTGTNAGTGTGTHPVAAARAIPVATPAPRAAGAPSAKVDPTTSALLDRK